MMSCIDHVDTENFSVNLNTTGSRKHSSKKMTTVQTDRRYLQTIQNKASQGQLTRPGEKFLKGDKEIKLKRIAPMVGELRVYKDPDTSSEIQVNPASIQSEEGSSQCQCQCHKEKSEDEIILEYMTKETTLQEWKDLAEERREALDNSLMENQKLMFETSEYKTQVSSLTQEVSSIEGENRRVSQQRDYFANILQNLVDEEATTEQQDSDDDTAGPDTSPGSADPSSPDKGHSEVNRTAEDNC